MEDWFQGGNMVQIMLEVKEGTILQPEILEKLLGSTGKCSSWRE